MRDADRAARCCCRCATLTRQPRRTLSGWRRGCFPSVQLASLTVPPPYVVRDRRGRGSMRLVSAGRDMRVDFFRGLALWWIFTDHIPGNWINQFSLRNFALCDSAEVFVLLAGYGAGLCLRQIDGPQRLGLRRRGHAEAGLDALYRAHLPVRRVRRPGRLFRHHLRPRGLPGRDPHRRAGGGAVSRHARGAAAAVPARLPRHPADVRGAAADVRARPCRCCAGRRCWRWCRSPSTPPRGCSG